MALKLVPKREPDPVESARLRVKQAKRPDGMLQCPECGGRAVCKVESGVTIKDGRRKAGTVIVKDVCDICRRVHNRLVTMRTGEEKPKRQK